MIGVVGGVRPNAMADANATIYMTDVSDRATVASLWGAEAAMRRPLVPAITQVLRDLDPMLLLIRARTMQDVLRGAAARQRLAMILMGAFAALTLVLASLGLYGILAYAVAGRARECGIRSAPPVLRSWEWCSRRGWDGDSRK